MAKPTETTGRDSTLRKLLVPTFAGAAGTAVAVALTKKPKQLKDAIPRVRDAMPDLPHVGVGEITDDLRHRLDSVIGKDSPGGDLGDFDGQAPADFDHETFAKRRAERRKRREQRRRRAA
jgi:hypothetical protein